MRWDAYVEHAQWEGRRFKSKPAAGGGAGHDHEWISWDFLRALSTATVGHCRFKIGLLVDPATGLTYLERLVPKAFSYPKVGDPKHSWYNFHFNPNWLTTPKLKRLCDFRGAGEIYAIGALSGHKNHGCLWTNI